MTGSTFICQPLSTLLLSRVCPSKVSCFCAWNMLGEKSTTVQNIYVTSLRRLPVGTAVMSHTPKTDFDRCAKSYRFQQCLRFWCIDSWVTLNMICVSIVSHPVLKKFIKRNGHGFLKMETIVKPHTWPILIAHDGTFVELGQFRPKWSQTSWSSPGYFSYARRRVELK